MSANLDSYHSFLQSLIGEEVQIYRGGPESKKGILLDVQSDYITLYAQNNNNNKNNDNSGQNQNQNQNQNNNQSTVVYYRTQHLQSISENSKSNSMPRFQNQNQEEEISFQSGEDFNELVQNLSGTYVQINQGGPESKSGLLLDCSGNYIALLTQDDGVVYYNIHHMKSISEYKQNNNDDGTQQEINVPEYVVADDFHDIFGGMSHKWVSINRGGPEALEGILVKSAGGHYTLINNEEVLRINPYHVKSISCGPKGALKQNNNNNSEQSNENSNQNNGSEATNSTDNWSGRRRSSSSSSSYRRSSSSSSRRRSSSSSRRRRSSSSSSSYTRNRLGSGGRRQRRFTSDRIMKTLDYIWNPRS